MRSACPANTASASSPILPAAGPGNCTSPYQSPGKTIEPDLNIATAGGAGYSSLKACGAGTEIDIVVNHIIPILNPPDVLPAFGAAFSLDSRLGVITLRFDL